MKKETRQCEEEAVLEDEAALLSTLADDETEDDAEDDAEDDSFAGLHTDARTALGHSRPKATMLRTLIMMKR